MQRLHAVRWAGLLAAAVLFVLASDTPRAQDAPAVDVKLVKYDGLIDVVRKLKGKVIVVDCWSLT